MRIGILKRELNRWMIGVEISRRWDIYTPWPRFRLWCMKLTAIPDEGSMLQKSQYKGFYWDWSAPLPNITVRTFRIGKKVFVLPINIRF